MSANVCMHAFSCPHICILFMCVFACVHAHINVCVCVCASECMRIHTWTCYLASRQSCCRWRCWCPCCPSSPGSVCRRAAPPPHPAPPSGAGGGGGWSGAPEGASLHRHHQRCRGRGRRWPGAALPTGTGLPVRPAASAPGDASSAPQSPADLQEEHWLLRGSWLG